MTSSTKVTLPKLIRVSAGGIGIITYEINNSDTLSGYAKEIEVLNHLLCLLPNDDKTDAELLYDKLGREFFVQTYDKAALKYAFKHGYLNEAITLHMSAIDHFLGDEAQIDAATYDIPAGKEDLINAVEAAVDSKVDKGLYEVVLLEDGNLYVRIDE